MNNKIHQGRNLTYKKKRTNIKEKNEKAIKGVNGENKKRTKQKTKTNKKHGGLFYRCNMMVLGLRVIDIRPFKKLSWFVTVRLK